MVLKRKQLSSTWESTWSQLFHLRILSDPFYSLEETHTEPGNHWVAEENSLLKVPAIRVHVNLSGCSFSGLPGPFLPFLFGVIKDVQTSTYAQRSAAVILMFFTGDAGGICWVSDAGASGSTDFQQHMLL